MAVTTVGTPIGGGDFNPVYNNIVWYFASTNINLPGFRYVVDVFEKTGPATQELITRLELPPRPSDNYAVADIGRILANYVTFPLLGTPHGSDSSRSYIRYNIEVRERYNVSYGWTSYSEAGGIGEFPEYTKLTFPSPTPFVAGDVIINFTSDPSLEPLLEGILTVIEVIDSQNIVVNREWSILNQGTGIVGDVIYADGRKFTSDVEETISDKVAFNGAISHVNFLGYNSDRFAMNTIDQGEFLTTIPSQFGVRMNSHIGFNIWNDFQDAPDFNYIYIEGSNTTIKRRNTQNDTTPIIYIPVGPGNLDESSYTLVSGPNLPIIDPVNRWYDIWAANSSGERISQKYRFFIDTTCTKWDDYQIVFLDRLGSLGCFNFYYLNEEGQSINRTQSNFILGDLQGDTWNFKSIDGGVQNTNVEIEETITLNTAWLTTEESRYLQQLISSPITWINVGENFFPVLVTDTTSVTRDTRSEKNIRHTVNFKIANSDTINW